MEQPAVQMSVVCSGVVALGALLSLATGPRAFGAETKSADDLIGARQQLYSAFAARLETLAQKCEAQGLQKQAELVHHWLPQRDALMIYIFMLPASSEAPKELVDTQAGREWWDRFMELRRAEAEGLFVLAQSAVKAKQYALAFELARETVRENPDHESARHVLGELKRGDEWVSPEAARRLDAGQVHSDEFGWLAADQLQRFQDGRRYYRGSWISAVEEARLRSNIHNGWNVESEHYAVVTNVSLEEGVKLTKE